MVLLATNVCSSSGSSQVVSCVAVFLRRVSGVMVSAEVLTHQLDQSLLLNLLHALTGCTAGASVGAEILPEVWLARGRVGELPPHRTCD